MFYEKYITSLAIFFYCLRTFYLVSENAKTFLRSAIFMQYTVNNSNLALNNNYLKENGVVYDLLGIANYYFNISLKWLLKLLSKYCSRILSHI